MQARTSRKSTVQVKAVIAEGVKMNIAKDVTELIGTCHRGCDVPVTSAVALVCSIVVGSQQTVQG